ncbi:MAG: leucyl aminopeptidase family protein [Steroidobacteraceae bacterium]
MSELPISLLPAATDPASARALWLVTEPRLQTLRSTLDEPAQRWLAAQNFQAERQRVLPLPDASGAVESCLIGLGTLAGADALSLWDGAALPERLPPGVYRVATELAPRAATRLVLGWLLGLYRFNKLRTQPRPTPAVQLIVPPTADLAYATQAAAAMTGARDLINAAPNVMGPEELAAAAQQLAQRSDGQCEITLGESLCSGYPLISAVGQGSTRAPRLIDCRWPRPGAPRVTLVGKGVCFDSGGLDIKPAAGMLLMKKDMGGAACVLALAELLLAQQAPIELRVLIPAVENAVGGNAFRPGDVWSSRAGLSVEIGNTDAEGRLVLADALAAADAETPDLLIDLATLTGAARTALGPDLPAVFSNDEALAQALRQAGDEEEDPVWPLPLWAGYDEELGSRVADLNNVSASPFAGAIIAALFLKRFVARSPAWLHVDLFAWNPKDRPGRPLGAEAQCVRALYRLIRCRYG